MSFTLPLGLLALAALPVIVGIYLLRRNFRPKTVSALFLWNAPKLRTGGGRKISKLETSLLLLIEILVAALLAFAAASPGCRKQSQISNIAIVLDDSASMSATENGKRFVMDSAKSAIFEQLAQSSPFVCTIILTGSPPKLLTTVSDNLNDISSALEQWNPGQAYHDHVSAFQIARQIFGKNKGKIVFITDKEPPIENGKVRLPGDTLWMAFGKKLSNGAICSAGRSVNFADGKEDIFAIVGHYGKSDGELLVSISVGERLIAEQKLRISQDSMSEKEMTMKKIAIEYPAISDEPVFIRIKNPDAMIADNEVMLLPEKKLPVKVKIRFADEKLRELVGEVITALGRECIESDLNPEIVFSDSADFLKEERGKSSKAWTFHFLSPEENAKKINYGPYIIEKQNPVCDGVYISGVRWVSTDVIMDSSDIIPLINIGSRPLFWEKNLFAGNSPREFSMNFKPSGSNLQKTPAFPILIGNIVRLRNIARPGFAEKNFRAGELASAIFPEAASVEICRVADSGQDSRAIESVLKEESEMPGNNLAVRFTSHIPGLFKLSEKTSGGDITDFIRYNFLCADESDLNSCASGKWEEGKGMGAVLNPYWKDEAWIFLLLAVGLLFMHLFLVNRKELRI